MKDLHEHVNPRNKKHSPLISKATHDIIMKYEDVSEYCIYYTLQKLISYYSVTAEYNEKIRHLGLVVSQFKCTKYFCDHLIIVQ